MEQYYICEENHVIEGKTFSGGCSARDIFPDGKPCHTFRSYALLAEGKNLTFKNCLFENMSGPDSRPDKTAAAGHRSSGDKTAPGAPPQIWKISIPF